MTTELDTLRKQLAESEAWGATTRWRQTVLREALSSAPILSKYHGQNGFETERFIRDYEDWRGQARQALAATEPQAKKDTQL